MFESINIATSNSFEIIKCLVITVRSYVLAIVYEWDLELGNDSFPIELFQTPRGATPRPTQVNKFWVKLRICDTYEKNWSLFEIRFISELTKKQFHLFLIISLDFNSIHSIVNEILGEWVKKGKEEIKIGKKWLHWCLRIRILEVVKNVRRFDGFDLWLTCRKYFFRDSLIVQVFIVFCGPDI